MEKREEMVLLMEKFAQSGQTQKEFSASKGMGVHKFNYWFRKLNKEMGEPSGFIHVDTDSSFSGKEEVEELVYPNGVEAENLLYRSFPALKADPSVLMFSLGPSHRYLPLPFACGYEKGL